MRLWEQNEIILSFQLVKPQIPEWKKKNVFFLDSDVFLVSLFPKQIHQKSTLYTE